MRSAITYCTLRGAQIQPPAKPGFVLATEAGLISLIDDGIRLLDGHGTEVRSFPTPSRFVSCSAYSQPYSHQQLDQTQCNLE